MCIAVVKPSGVEVPQQVNLRNCFENNPHGAGFMFIRDNKIHIKKGYMNFTDFYTAFCSENFGIEDTVFIHFRIATHGLVDGGNTHPFPVTNIVQDLRKRNISFNGYGLIHNGIFSYPKQTFKRYDPTGVISDTMLFTLRLYDEIYHTEHNRIYNSHRLIDYFFNGEQRDIEFMIKETLNGSNRYINTINRNLGYNKVAILKDNGEWKTFGKWVNHNGVLYSNLDFEDNWKTKWNRLGFTRTRHITKKDLTNCCICSEIIDSTGGISIGDKEFCWYCFDNYCVDSIPITQQFFTCSKCKKEHHNSWLVDNKNNICYDCIEIEQKNN